MSSTAIPMEGWTARAVERLNSWSTRWVPGSFVIACLLTLFSFGMVLVVARKTPFEALGYWIQGFWQLLEFAMQMSLILLTGYMVAVSPPVARFLDAIVGIPKTDRAAVALMGVVTMVLSWIHWGLGAIGGPILLRFLMKKHPQADYRLAVTTGYLGIACTWHAGLSGSAPLLMATPKHFMERQVGIIPMSLTTFSAFNLLLTIAVMCVITVAVVKIYPSKPVPRANQAAVGEASSSGRGEAERAKAGTRFSLARFLESHYSLNFVFGLLGLAALAVSFKTEGFHFSLNIFNFVFLFLALLLHPSPASFVRAAAQGTEFLQGIIIQFPFYAGMYGLINYSGLAVTIGRWFVAIANSRTFPLIIYWYSGILSYFIPSGGSKWVVEAPYVLEAAKSLGVPVEQAILSYAWGDMSTHFLQPFWAIPLLTVAKLEFSDILGYLGILFLVNGVVVSAAFLLMPRVW